MEVVRRGRIKDILIICSPTPAAHIKISKPIWSVWMMPVRNFLPSPIPVLKCFTWSKEILYRHGDEVFYLQPGDCLTLEGEIPHGPETATSSSHSAYFHGELFHSSRGIKHQIKKMVHCHLFSIFLWSFTKNQAMV